MWSGIPISFRIFHSLLSTQLRFGVVSKAEIDVFLELSSFINDPTDGSLISGSSAFSRSCLNTWKFVIHILLKPDLENLSITFLVCDMSATVWSFECSLAWPLGLE